MQHVSELFTSKGLYSDVLIATKDAADVNNALLGFTIDVFCPQCQSLATYTRDRNESDVYCVARDALAVDQLEAAFKYVHVFRCARNKKHVAYFVTVAEQIGNGPTLRLRVTKIGQHPSLADLTAHNHRDLKYLDSADQRDIKQAHYLSAHGVGAGALVYLRRVLERMVNEKVEQSGLDEELRNARFAEKVDRLKDQLPEFLTDNKIVYGILSAGVHELSEEECRAAYPILKDAIDIILRQKAEAIERQRKEQETSANLQRLNQVFQSK